MASDLLSSSGSAYVSAMNAFRPSSSLPEVIIYVEGWDDVPFWTTCVQPYLDRFRFTIGPLQLPDGNIADGKSHLMANVPLSSLGPCMIIALDADYDWIIDNYRPSPTVPSLSPAIRDNDYILHTYLYSTENYKCHAACLPGIIAKATGVTPGPECQAYQSAFSEAVSQLFLIHLVSAHKVDNFYTIRRFVSDIDKINLDLNTLQLKPNSRKYLTARMNELAPYMASYRSETDTYEEKLDRLGFDRKKYYMLFKGHCVADTMTKKRLHSLILKLRCKRINEIKAIPDSEKSSQHLAAYCNVTGISQYNKPDEIDDRLTQLIKDCTDITNAREGYDRLKADLDRLFSASRPQ